MQEYEPEMTAQEVIKIVQLFEENAIEVYIDGGWGVDALLGKQTRTHTDLDIAVQHKDVAQIRVLLETRGYQDRLCDDTRDYNFVLVNHQGNEIDIHSYTFDSTGNHVYGIEYPYDSLSGHGLIAGYPVRCISPKWMVRFHTGYAFDENDYRDVKALCYHFGIMLPLEYEEFEKNCG
ncbi:MAG: nucleotidyltransferase family protein [Nostoc sp. DedQUE08]|uniref:nucleotidyltransferase domain-containing protein n=1 Tax=Nostoc sp. DedQUE08 TaxID=3075393 RepID=UPI002AD543E5|nr:nucleotidyltransferase family protein [Nostoc sp. DedQUE08]MDZ8066036.1 nucleotidyltransferase family protein [Nostoc sp. DedQUE08]